MRIESPKAKEMVEVDVPTVVAEFMRDVTSLIDADDEAVTMESDDLLQAPRIYGGLTDATTHMFGFTYFPTKDTLPVWELDFRDDEIRQIATGQVTRLRLLRCKRPDCGCHFSSPEDRCFRCDYEPQM